MKALEKAPDHTTIHKRIGCKRIKITNNMAIFDGKTLTVGPIPDGIGLEPIHRGKWLRAKWKVRRGFIKMYIPIEESRKIVAFKLSDDSTGDS